MWSLRAHLLAAKGSRPPLLWLVAQLPGRIHEGYVVPLTSSPKYSWAWAARPGPEIPGHARSGLHVGPGLGLISWLGFAENVILA
jgi:hypothetical protein